MHTCEEQLPKTCQPCLGLTDFFVSQLLLNFFALIPFHLCNIMRISESRSECELISELPAFLCEVVSHVNPALVFYHMYRCSLHLLHDM